MLRTCWCAVACLLDVLEWFVFRRDRDLVSISAHFTQCFTLFIIKMKSNSQKVAFNRYTLVHGCPGSGKTSTQRYLKDKGIHFVDTDPILFGFIMPKRVRERLKELGWRAGAGTEAENLLYSCVTRAVLAIAGKIAAEHGGYLFTNLQPSKIDQDVVSESVTAFLQPEVLYKRVDARNKRKGNKGPRFTLDQAKNWYQNWKRNRGRLPWSKVIELSESDYLSDVLELNLAPEYYNDLEDVYDVIYPLMRSEHWFDLVEPDIKKSK